MHFVSPSLCTAYTTPSFPFSLPLRTGSHRHPCAVRAISAASGHSNKHQQRSTAAEACVCQRQRFLRLRSACLVSAQRACARLSEPALPACLCVSTICLPARCLLSYLLACLHSCCCSSCCLSTSITTAGPSGLVVDTLHRSLSRLLACLFEPALPVRLRHCPALPGFVGSHLPRQRIHSHHRIPTGTPAPSQSLSQLHEDTPVLSSSLDRPTRQRLQHHLAGVISSLAQALISPTCRLLAACDLLDLAASATVSAPSPCDAAANNNATASLQLFACGRPIHLATSSPNKRADFRSFLA